MRGKAAYAAGFHRLNRDKQGVFLSGENYGKRIIFKLESRLRAQVANLRYRNRAAAKTTMLKVAGNDDED